MDRRKFLELPLYGLPLLLAGRMVGQDLQTVSSLKQKAPVVLMLPATVLSQGRITTPKEQFGFNVCDDYHLVTLSQFTAYWNKLAAESDRIKLISIGKTEEGREQLMAIVTSPANHRRLEHYRDISARLSRARGLTDETAMALAKEGKAVVWIDGGMHSDELLTAQQLVEHVYRMAARNDAETLRILDDVIQLVVLANPDGLELLATEYMKNPVPKERSMGGVSDRPYQKYIDHDNNRDFYMNAMAESKNMSRVMYREWYPQIVYNHHQAGMGLIDISRNIAPLSDNVDPIALASGNLVSEAIGVRFTLEGKPGALLHEMPTSWSNGYLSSAPYFHNQIGILIETQGRIEPFRDARFHYMFGIHGSTNYVYPAMPRIIHFRDGMEYDLTANMALLNYASRMREELLYNICLMGRNSIRRGSEDSWTLRGNVSQRLAEATAKAQETKDGERLTTEEADRRRDQAFANTLRRPEDRDARGYILPSDQADFLTATRFVNALIESGVEVSYATQAFSVKRREYPAGSYIIKTAQAFRPQVLDMFEPQWYPNPSGRIPVEDRVETAGYTLALQMGVHFDRILESFECPCVEVKDVLKKPPVERNLPQAPGYLLSRKVNDSYRVVNRLLRARQSVLAAGEFFYVPATRKSADILRVLTAEHGVPTQPVADRPTKGQVIKPFRVGLVDRYGGSMQSGWIRWLLEQFEFPFEVVYPPMLDKEDLSRFDALILPVGAYGVGDIPKLSDSPGPVPSDAEKIQEMKNYRIPLAHERKFGNISQLKTLPKLKEFVKHGGRVIAIGGPVTLAEHFGFPISDHLQAKAGVGRESLQNADIDVMPSLLEVAVDSSTQAALGMESTAIAFFSGKGADSSTPPHTPVMRLMADAEKQGLKPIAWYAKPDPLRSGWLAGGQHFEGGAAAVQAQYGKGTVYLYGVEITYRGQSHGTLKLLFNGLIGK